MEKCDRKQREQLNRSISNSPFKSKQLKRFVISRKSGITIPQVPILQRIIKIAGAELKPSDDHSSITNGLSSATTPIFNTWLSDTELHEYVDSSKLIEAIEKYRTAYHFGINTTEGHGFGPRMDYIDRHKAGTIAEFDWWKDLFDSYHPSHIAESDHVRLSGEYGKGLELLSKTVKSDKSNTREAAADYKKKGGSIPGAILGKSLAERYIWGRKALSSKKTFDKIRTDIKSGIDLGVDFSKAALVDQLVQGKDIYMHLTGFKTIWKTSPSLNNEEMTGADYKTVLTKDVSYGTGKDHVSLRELRFVWRYWTRKLSIPDDTGVVQEYTFENHVHFYYNDKEVPAPWTWNDSQKGSHF